MFWFKLIFPDYYAEYQHLHSENARLKAVAAAEHTARVDAERQLKLQKANVKILTERLEEQSKGHQHTLPLEDEEKEEDQGWKPWND